MRELISNTDSHLAEPRCSPRSRTRGAALRPAVLILSFLAGEDFFEKEWRQGEGLFFEALKVRINFIPQLNTNPLEAVEQILVGVFTAKEVPKLVCYFKLVF